MFSVWAPEVKNVQLFINDKLEPMKRNDNGWWQSDIEATHGTDYGFCIDGGGPLPDPRSPWQPNGVDGLSRHVDHSLFQWSDQRWQSSPLASAIIYELHVGTFSEAGTFEGIIDKLDHLVGLGVTHIELMPVVQFSGSHGWGYDGVDLFAPHSSYGGPDGLKKLINACHGKGLGVLLDVVYNHFGPKGNYTEQYGQYMTERYHTPWGKAVNFDDRWSDEVRRFVCDNAAMWLRDYHADGLRLDDIDAIFDRRATHIIEDISHTIHDLSAFLGRHLYLTAESNINTPRVVEPFRMNGFELDAQWNDEFHHALHVALTGERYGYYADFGGLREIAHVMKRVFLLEGNYSKNLKHGHGKPVHNLSGHRFLAYSQSHDQIGNRAQGDRLCHLVSTGLAKAAAALVMMSPYVPMLFQGEEWAASSPFLYFTQFEDKELAQSVSRGRKKSLVGYGWQEEDVADPQAPETFERSRLKWDEIEQGPHRQMLDWYKELIRLRKKFIELTNGNVEQVQVDFDEEKRLIWMQRGRVICGCNLSRVPARIPVKAAEVLLASADEVRIELDGVMAPPESTGIFRARI